MVQYTLTDKEREAMTMIELADRLFSESARMTWGGYSIPYKDGRLLLKKIWGYKGQQDGQTKTKCEPKGV